MFLPIFDQCDCASSSSPLERVNRKMWEHRTRQVCGMARWHRSYKSRGSMWEKLKVLQLRERKKNRRWNNR